MIKDLLKNIKRIEFKEKPTQNITDTLKKSNFFVVNRKGTIFIQLIEGTTEEKQEQVNQEYRSTPINER